MKSFVAGMLALWMLFSAHADEKAVQKYRNYTPQQIAAMPEKTRSSELPMMYIWAAQKGMAKGVDLVFGMELNKLMYPGLADYKRAVMEFQKDLGDPPNGVLTVWQIHQLTKRSEMQALGSFTFPDRFISFKNADYAKVEGTMRILDDRIAWPINHQVMRCYKQRGVCELEELLVMVPNDSSFAQAYSVMRRDPDFYEITKWDQDVIEATVSDTGNACRSTTVTLNFKAKEFYFITRNGTKECDVMGTPIPRLEKPC